MILLIHFINPFGDSIMTTAQTTQATETQTAPAATPTTPSTKEGINWGGVGKTVGVFALGAAAGAAGKWAFDHFFG
jgi:hypothetical protein